MFKWIKQYLQTISLIELIFLTLLIILFTYSKTIKAAEMNAVVYFSSDCKYVNENSFEITNDFTLGEGFSLLDPTDTFLPNFGDISTYATYVPQKIYNTYSSSELHLNYPCLQNYPVVAFTKISIMAARSGGGYRSFNHSNGVNQVASIGIYAAYILSDNPMDCDYPSSFYSIKHTYDKNFCNYNVLRETDKNCLSHFGDEVDIYVPSETENIGEGYPLTSLEHYYLTDDNNPDNSFYCNLSYVSAGNNDGSCKHFVYKFDGSQNTATEGEIEGIHPFYENLQDSSCEYIATGNNSPNVDTDGDGEPDSTDLDDDDDGYADGSDAFPYDPNEWQDSDGDGVGDNSDAFPNDPYEWEDSDNDGTGNNEEIDDDNDGVPDSEDQFPNDPNESEDSDGDGVGDNADKFPNDQTEHSDNDNDGVGDNADPDDDNDGFPDNQDQFPNDPTENIDTDNDGVGDNADPDDDNDGVPDSEDGVDNLGSGDLWYESKYPNGLSDIYDNKMEELFSGSFGEFVKSFDFSGQFDGSADYPVFDFPFSQINENWEDKSLDLSNLYGYNLWDIIKAIILSITMFYAFRIVIGV